MRLRTVAGPTIEGRVITIGPDSLSLEGATGRINVPKASVLSLETWRGRGTRWRSGAEIGAFAGFAATSAVFAARMRNCVGIACAKIVRWKVYAATAALGGAVIGGLVGATFKHDRWEGVPLGLVHPQIALSGGDQGIGLTIRF